MAATAAERMKLHRARRAGLLPYPEPRDYAAPKACKTCGETKPLAEFRKHSVPRDGHGAHCLLCSNAKMRTQKRRLVQERPEIARAHWRDNARRWRFNNRVLYRERTRVACAKWRLADPERKNAYERAWYAKNLLRARAIKHKSELNRRAFQAEAFVEKVDPRAVYERDGGVCGICKLPVSLEERWHVDHVMPLSKGGEHSYANVQLAHAKCNIVKSAALPLRKAG